jgi:branched-chain amino acid transport system permease protein
MIDLRGSKALDRYRLRWPELLPIPGAIAVYFLFPHYLVFAASVMVMALFALSLDLIIGFAGLLTLGHGVFFGIGAYAAGLLAIGGLREPILNAICSAALSASAALLVGPFILRLRGLKLIMVTLAIASITLEAANQASWLTGGHDGLQNIAFAAILGRFEWTLDGSTAYIYVAAWLALSLALLRVVVVSPFGLALQGARENETRMLVMGAPVQMQLCLAFGLSAALAGLAGALSTQTNAFVSLDTLSLDLSIFALAMLVLGGIGRLYGALLGAAVYMSVQYFTQELNPSYWMFAIGALLILVVRFGRGGLLGMAETVLRRLPGRGAVS